MKSKIYLLLLLFSLSIVVDAQSFTYYCGFEQPEDTAGWRFVKRPAVQSNFVIGNAVHRIGTSSMYVSSDGGVTAGYISTASGYSIVAYRKFTLTAGQYDLGFDLRIVGDARSDNDVLRVAYFPTTKADGTAQTPAATAVGSSFSPVVLNNAFIDYKGKQVFVGMPWTNIQGVMTIPQDGDYYLAFYFKENGGINSNFNPGPCIDNIQISTKQVSTHCAAKPTNVNVTNQAGQVVISWQGNATSYELMYYSTSNSSNTSYKVVNNITTNSYTIPMVLIEEGSYVFHVRAICPPDTSIWEETKNFLVYDPAAHCLDFLNFTAPGVTCTSGLFSNPYRTVGVVDFGPESKQSIHTVHTDGSEYDRLTGYQLKTVPDGSLASVRLSNWTETNSNSGSITYTYTVDPDAKVLLLRYAAVLQYADHHPANEQTRIHVEVLDVNNRLLSHCTEADFNARDVAEGNTRGWNTYQPTDDEVENSECPIKWLNWSILGINLEAYAGMTVKIKLTLYACSADFHFGYAYFTLDCTKGDIEGLSCGETPDHFTAPAGFDYKWYKANDPTMTEISNEQTYIPALGDTLSYYVDVMYPENHACKFRLSAYMLPRVPISAGTFKRNAAGCKNEVKFTNVGNVYEFPPTGNPRPTTDTIQSYLWNFGDYGTSVLKSPTLILPNEGDTFQVVLRTGFNGCMGYDTFMVNVPAVSGSTGYDTAYICEGSSIIFNGHEYSQAGDYEEQLQTVYGCDSILMLHLMVLSPDSILTYDTICSDQTIEFFDQIITEAGVYEHHVPSSLGCDTLFYQVTVKVHDVLQMSLQPSPSDICADDSVFSIPYNLHQGIVTGYSLEFDSTGFTPLEYTPIEDDVFIVPMPKGLRPNKYSGTVTFYNADCGNIEVPFNFVVNYPSSILTQRWNDVLSVYNSEYNGGYEFINFQWFLDGEPVPNMISSHFYQQGKDLEFGHDYSVLLTRLDDNLSFMSCAIVPQKFELSDDVNNVNVLFSGTTVNVESPAPARAELYSVTGAKITTWTILQGNNNIPLTDLEGVYILRILFADGNVHTERLVVKK